MRSRHAVKARRDRVIEDECVPREAAAGSEGRGDPLERSSPVGPGRKVQE
jgi:hypothetical protein